MRFSRKLLGPLLGLGAGFGDSAAAALATFSVGAFAVRLLSSEGLALFSLFMTGLITCALLPQQLVFMPTRIRSNLSLTRQRPALRTDLRLAVPSSLAAAVLVLSFGLPLLGHVDVGQYLAMGITASAATILGAVQTHIRATMHVLNEHAAAACTSLLALGIVVTLLAVSEMAHFVPWVEYAFPFGSLAIGYGVSSLIWTLVARRHEKMTKHALPMLRERILYVGPDITVQLTWYCLSLLVVAVLGPVQLADLEAARVVAAPVFILASGLTSYALPSVIRAISSTTTRAAFKQGTIRLKRLQAMVATCATVYGLLLLLAGPVLSSLFQRNVNPPLSASRALAFGVEGASNVINPMFVVAGRPGRGLAVIVGACVVSLAAAVPSLLLLGPYGLPVAQGLSSAARIVAGSSLLRKSMRAPQSANSRKRGVPSAGM